MKPLSKIIKIIGEKEISQYEHRNLLVSLAEQTLGCHLKLKDGTVLKVTLKDNNEVTMEKVEPYYEFDDENEIKMFLTTDNEEFENFIRWQKLKNILDEDDEKPLI